MKNAQEARWAPHFTRVKEVEGVVRSGGRRAKGWDIYIDDRVRPDGHAYPTRDGRIIGHLTSPKGYTARSIANSIQALDDGLAQWADDGLPANSPLVEEWTKAEGEIFQIAIFDFRVHLEF